MKGPWLGLAPSVLCLCLASVCAANAQTAEPIDHWNTNAVMAALQAVKASDIQAVTSEGRAVVTARSRDGLNVGVYAKSCDPAPPGVEAICHGLEAIISFDPGGKTDRRALADQLNHQFALGKFLAEPDGAIRLSRYVVLDGGVGPGNLRAELASLFAIGALTGKTLWPETARR
jgi:hypothetical protein